MIDANRIATAVPPLSVDKLRKPRLKAGIRQTIQILVTARQAMTKDRTRSVNTLIALVPCNSLGLNAREDLNRTKVAKELSMANPKRR